MNDATHSLRQRLQDDMKSALKAGERERLSVIRLILAAVKQKEIDERTILTDGEVIAILNKMVKQRKESIAQYQAGNRDDLVQAENAEIKIIQSYLPDALTEEETAALIKEAISQTGASSVKDMGKVMAALRSATQGRADMAAVGARVKRELESST
jgi:uncharacterized protein YqeY